MSKMGRFAAVILFSFSLAALLFCASSEEVCKPRSDASSRNHLRVGIQCPLTHMSNGAVLPFGVSRCLAALMAVDHINRGDDSISQCPKFSMKEVFPPRLSLWTGYDKAGWL